LNDQIELTTLVCVQCGRSWHPCRAAKTEEVSESGLPFNVLGRNQIQSITRAIFCVANDERQARCSIILNFYLS
jgi:hypothetical protein